jgi:hypothetical protein
MTIPELEVHPRAAWEARRIRRWYARRSMQAPERFVAEFRAGIQLILERPEHWPKYLFSTRCLRLHKFPYLLVYEYSEGKIRLLAVAHGKKKPGYWARRQKK